MTYFPLGLTTGYRAPYKAALMSKRPYTYILNSSGQLNQPVRNGLQRLCGADQHKASQIL